MMTRAVIAAVGEPGSVANAGPLARFARLPMAGMLLLLVLAAGCQKPPMALTSLPDPSFRPQISAHEMARRLGLSVRELSPRHALLADGTNTVLLMVGPAGRAYVNGKPVGRASNIAVRANTIWIPADLTETVRGRLAAARLQPPAPSRQVQIPQSPVNRLISSSFHVVVDAGHGGKDPGAASVYGVNEKTITLAVARSLAAQLSRLGATVTLTRDSDRFVELDERAAIANRNNADLFVSIHADSSRNRRATGYTVYVCRDATGQSTQAASVIEQALRSCGFSSRGIRHADYRVLVKTRCPAILVEIGYLSNPSQARSLADWGMQQRLAESLAEGLVSSRKARADRIFFGAAAAYRCGCTGFPRGLRRRDPSLRFKDDDTGWSASASLLQRLA